MSARAEREEFSRPYGECSEPTLRLGRAEPQRARGSTMKAAQLLLVCALAGCGVELEHGLDERQANEVVSVLESAGISADKTPEDGQANAYKIVVARAEA